MLPGVRRYRPEASQNRRVPLWTAEPEGQLFQGIIRVPVELCHSAEHTNRRHQFDKLIVANLARWTEWRAKRGWMLNERPRIQGPFDPMEGDRARTKKFQSRAEEVIGRNRDAGAITTFDYAGEVKWYIAEARFRREDPIYARLEDMIELRHMALQYEVDPDRDPLPYNELPEGKDELFVEGGLDPMKVAEERRQALGLKREDFLFGPIEEPL